MTTAIDPPPGADTSIAWCLLSHTNIGKTTLARTLLADDVGEIQDAAHVTSQSQRYLLEKSGQGDTLWLWDTPGFGDSLRLYERLRQQGNPLGWFLTHVWDRWRDRPFYLSQRALLAARDHADVMLYLVNAAEDPADAGYWESEMRILQWMRKPVVVVLNQIGSDTSPEQTAADLQRWQRATAAFGDTVRSVRVLDAFTRSWRHESEVLGSIAPLLPTAKQAAYQRLLQSRSARERERVEASLQALAAQLAAAARLQEQADAPEQALWQRALHLVKSRIKPAPDASPQEAGAMQRLLHQLQAQDVECTQRLLALHRLDGNAASQIQQQLREQLQISTPIDPQAAGLWGALTAAAASGLGADLLAGGMTLGAGAILGALVGAVTFAGAAWGANKVFDQQAQRFTLSGPYLDALAAQALLKYLVISHFGRGQGRYTSPAAPQRWNDAVQAALQARADELAALWPQLRGTVDPAAPQQALQLLLAQCLDQALARIDAVA
ncbi:hypothetical protein GCM10027082_41650 [Comamonas humi]